jgi:hypothetical protein
MPKQTRVAAGERRVVEILEAIPDDWSELVEHGPFSEAC